MKTILVPVDFSATARNCALYAAGLAKDLGVKKIVLFNAYSIPLATEMSWAVLQTEELKLYSEEGLRDFKELIAPIVENEVEIELASEFGFLPERIEAVCKETNSEMIVMGITGGGKIEEVLIGSNTTHILKHTEVPLLIVPSGATWKHVEVIGWACDYKNVITTTPLEEIKKMVIGFHAKLVVVHNEPDPEAFDPEKQRNNILVSDRLNELNPEFVQVAETNFSEAMNHFVDQHQIDMLLVIPKKQSWIDSIFHRSHTTQLAFHSHVPLLCLRMLNT